MENQRSLHHYIPFERSEHDKNYTSCENDSFAEEKKVLQSKTTQRRNSRETVQEYCRNSAGRKRKKDEQLCEGSAIEKEGNARRGWESSLRDIQK